MSLEKIEIDKKLLEYSLSQFRNIPEYVAMCEAIAKGMNTVQDCVDYLSDMIDIDKAEGVWLDYIGKLVGISRATVVDDLDYFCVNSDDVNEEKYFYFGGSNLSSSNESLDDKFFKGQIKAKIAYNICKGTKEELITMVKNLMGIKRVKIRKESPMLLDITLVDDVIVETNEGEFKDRILPLLPNGVGINGNIEIEPLDIKYSEEYKKRYGYNNIKFCNNRFYLLGDYNRFGYSDDGENFPDCNIDKTVRHSWKNMAYGNNLYIVIGSIRGGTTYAIATSTDGINWTIQEQTLNYNSSSYPEIVYGNKAFVTNMSGNKYTTNGIDWFSVNGVSESFSSITFGKDKFVAVTTSSGFYSSVDGKNWILSTYITLPESGDSFKFVKYGNNGVFIAVSYGGYVTTSTDGILWSEPEKYIDLGSGVTDFLQAITYGKTKFVIITQSGKVFHSVHGDDWIEGDVLPNYYSENNYWFGVDYGFDKFIFLGEQMSIDGYIE